MKRYVCVLLGFMLLVAGCQPAARLPIGEDIERVEITQYACTGWPPYEVMLVTDPEQIQRVARAVQAAATDQPARQEDTLCGGALGFVFVDKTGESFRVLYNGNLCTGAGDFAARENDLFGLWKRLDAPVVAGGDEGPYAPWLCPGQLPAPPQVDLRVGGEAVPMILGGYQWKAERLDGTASSGNADAPDTGELLIGKAPAVFPAGEEYASHFTLAAHTHLSYEAQVWLTDETGATQTLLPEEQGYPLPTEPGDYVLEASLVFAQGQLHLAIALELK